MKIQITWTPLPQGSGFVKGSFVLKLGMVATIRVTDCPGATVGSIKALLDWPAQVASWQFVAVLETGAGKFAVPFKPLPDTIGGIGGPLDWWRALFPSATPLEPFVFKPLTNFASYDAAPLAKLVDDFYGTNGLTAIGPMPSLARFGGRNVPPLSIGDKNGNRVRHPALNRFDAYRAVIAGALPGDINLTKDQIAATEAELAKRAATLNETLDFHARLSAVSRHGPLQAKLRLSLVAELPVLPVLLAGGGAVTIVTGHPASTFAPAQQLPDGAPRIGFDGFFNPAPVKGDSSVPTGFVARGGHLDLKASGVTAIAIDVDGAIARLKGLEATIASQSAAEMEHFSASLADPGNPASPDAAKGRFLNQLAGPPALNVDGISLVVDRAVQLTAAVDRQIALDAALKGGATAKSVHSKGEVKSGDVVVIDVPGIEQTLIKGWRLDVRDVSFGSKAAEWRSLHRRTTSFKLAAPNTPVLSFEVVDNEGSLTTAAVVQGLDAPRGAPSAVHPALAVWRGWSLSAPHPAQAIGPSLGDGPDVAPPGNPALAKLGLSVVQSLARGLPRFRYGRRYQFRLRAMDLAGAGLAVTAEAPAAAVTPSITATRSSPVEPPVPTFTSNAFGQIDGPLAGGSIERMVVRTLASPSPEPVRAATRLLYPPRVPVGVAEFHEAFDDNAGRLDPDKFGDGGTHAELVRRDHADVTPDPSLKNNSLATADVALEFGIRSINSRFGPASASTEVKQQRVMRDERQPINYLPDPAAVGMALWLEPVRVASAPATPSTDYLYLQPWPERRPLLVTLRAGPKGFGLTSDGMLEITLPPGETADLMIASRIATKASSAMYVRHQAARLADPATLTAIDGAIVAGRHWMTAPPRRIQLVHAVQKPIVAPVAIPQAVLPTVPPFGALTLKRAGDRHVAVRMVASVNRNSTGEVNILAHWSEPQDALPDEPLSNPGVRDIASTVAFTHRLGEADFIPADLPGQPVSTAALQLKGRHNLPDTMARRITYTPEAVSRFREFMPVAIRGPQPPNAADPFVPPMAVTGTPGTGHILSSAVPPPPRIAYVVPFFDWIENSQPLAQTRIRKGNGLRVYLERPWFATGFNEMLAVVIDECERGQDPLYRSDRVTPSNAKLEFGDFAGHIMHFATKEPGYWNNPATPWGAKHREEAFALPKVPARVQLKPVGASETSMARETFVVPYVVDWDAERGLWFVDIEIPAIVPLQPIRDAAPFRFVRLALARYQPMSVPFVNNSVLTAPGTGPNAMFMDVAGMAALPEINIVNEPFDLHLSERVLTDFCQLMPDRLAAVSQAPDCWRQVVVTGLEDGHKGRPTKPDPALRYDLRVETLPSGGNPDFDWVAVTPVTKEIFQFEKKPPFVLLALSILRIKETPKQGAKWRIMVFEYDFVQPQGQTDRLVYFDYFEASEAPPGPQSLPKLGT